MKKIIFQHRDGVGEHNIHREEVEFEDNATEEEISEEFETWVWEQVIGDSVTWYEKEEK